MKLAYARDHLNQPVSKCAAVHNHLKISNAVASGLDAPFNLPHLPY